MTHDQELDYTLISIKQAALLARECYIYKVHSIPTKAQVNTNEYCIIWQYILEK